METSFERYKGPYLGRISDTPPLQSVRISILSLQMSLLPSPCFLLYPLSPIEGVSIQASVVYRFHWVEKSGTFGHLLVLDICRGFCLRCSKTYRDVADEIDGRELESRLVA